MKDVTHHLRHVQKKVIQSARKDSNVSLNGHIAESKPAPSLPSSSRRKFDENHRTPRILKRIGVH